MNDCDQFVNAKQRLFFTYNQIRNELNRDFNRQISYLEKLKYSSIQELDKEFYSQMELLDNSTTTKDESICS